jgi:hypothetical protein
VSLLPSQLLHQQKTGENTNQPSSTSQAPIRHVTVPSMHKADAAEISIAGGFMLARHPDNAHSPVKSCFMVVGI